MEGATMTITEGLAEIKTVGKRIAKKREFVMTYLGRQEGLKDPFASEEGGSSGAVARELQGIVDLEERIVSIRRAIAEANTRTIVTLEGSGRSVADWLVWRREVAAQRGQFVSQLLQRILQTRRDAQSKGFAVTTSSEKAAAPTDVIINIDEKKVSDESEKLQKIIDDLDGQLSLTNATVMITLS
jgi:hypothetical protein